MSNFPSSSNINDEQDPGEYSHGLSREWCTGHPPKPSGFDHFMKSRRSTLANKLELDDHLKTSVVPYESHLYLLLNDHNVARLSPFWKREKPIADLSIFERLLLTKDINKAHADHAVAAIKRIGDYVKHLVIVAPIHTTELGDVFNREEGDINTGNDWDKILECFPNLETVTFDHPEEEPSDLTRSTFHNFQRAVNAAKIDSLENVIMNVPGQISNEFPSNAIDYPQAQDPLADLDI
ncbi:hypothetical protein K458DRAFT_181151 [Lentithecium fluviatile CBS 122367]|uniref:Uncharacterized protein n=1 Tax=Lentithecium fluviatile CBS 122367 TaxID=1168545 RepID=A0A6G1IF42_9PLEO|nr:hypothetical protein K458DRAFT_181151 [Lentithecium fluviatile CBS 122367]